MKLKSLSLKNFKNISELNITFSSLINLVEGANGSGKTSILEAITYILTDTLNDKISEYVKWGKDKFNIELCFEHLGDDYVMSIEGSTSAKKELVINGKDRYKNSEATKKLAEIIDPTITRYSAISEQGQSTMLLFDKPTNRLERLKEILGIDKLGVLADEMKEEIKAKTTEIDSKKQQIKLLESREFNFLDVPEVSDNIEDIKLSFSVLSSQKETYESDLLKYQEYERNKNAYDLAQIKIKDSNSNAIKLLEDKNKILLKTESTLDVEKCNNDILELEKSKIKLHNEQAVYIQAQNKIKVLTDEISSNEEDITKLNIRRISPCEYTEEERTQYNSDFISKGFEFQALEKEIDLVKSGKCPTCKRDFEVSVDSLLLKKDALKKEVDDLCNKKNEVNNVIETYKKLVEDQEKSKIKKEGIQTAIDKAKKELEELSLIKKVDPSIDYSVEIEKIKSAIKEHNDIVAYNTKAEKDIQQIQNQIEVLLKVQQEYTSVIEPVKVEEPVMYDINKYNEVSKELLIYDQKVSEKNRIVLHNENIKKQKDTNESEIEELKKFISAESHAVGILEESRKIIDKDFSSYLIDKGASYIKEKMNEFFQRSYGKYDITFNQDKNSINFFYGDGTKVAPVQLASGFEKQALALSFRSALCSIQNLNFMILDEIDGESSTDNSIRLFDTLLTSTKNTNFIIITHKEETKEFLLNQNGAKRIEVKNGSLI